MRDGAPAIDALVSLTGFSLVGGPAYNDSKAAEAMLAALDVPYIAAHPVEFQTLEQWEDSERGLLPVEATMMVAIPELDGATGPMIFGGRSSRNTASSAPRHRAPHPERADRCSPRASPSSSRCAARRARSARSRSCCSTFRPNAGSTGTAAYPRRLRIAASHAARDEGATATASRSRRRVDALRDRILQGNAARFGADANVHARIPVDDHVRRERRLAEIEAQWGPAPGRQQTDGASIFVLGERFGNVFVGIQPAFGYEGDPMRLLFERGFAPTHAFSAFYRWISEDFGAHAVLHFGTHGALEFMPGKQAGMSGACWPDRLIGDLPNFYLYASNNPSEGMIAKRRAGGDTDQLPDAAGRACRAVSRAARPEGVAGSLARAARRRPSRNARALAALIQAQAAAVDLADGRAGLGRDARSREIARARRRGAGTGIHADPAWAACRRRAAAPRNASRC